MFKKQIKKIAKRIAVRIFQEILWPLIKEYIEAKIKGNRMAARGKPTALAEAEKEAAHYDILIKALDPDEIV